MPCPPPRPCPGLTCGGGAVSGAPIPDGVPRAAFPAAPPPPPRPKPGGGGGGVRWEMGNVLRACVGGCPKSGYSLVHLILFQPIFFSGNSCAANPGQVGTIQQLRGPRASEHSLRFLHVIHPCPRPLLSSHWTAVGGAACFHIISRDFHAAGCLKTRRHWDQGNASGRAPPPRMALFLRLCLFQACVQPSPSADRTRWGLNPRGGVC